VKPDAILLECPFDRLLTTVENRFGLMGLPAFPFARLLVFWGGVQGGFNGFAHNPVEYARSVQCPAFVLAGERDPRARLQDTRAVFDALSEPRTFKVFTNLAHQSFLEGQPEEWKKAVSEFLTGLKLQSGSSKPRLP
jgi:pimeloyl-ACP methyl ester carboxylesterase